WRRRLGRSGRREPSVRLPLLATENLHFRRDRMTEAEQGQMARDFFGFGNRAADFWTIGPEQGMLKDDSTLATRFEAWTRMDCKDLLDCRKYHAEIGEHRWHGSD